MADEEKHNHGVGREGVATDSQAEPALGTPKSGRLSFREWDTLKEKLVDEVRKSERLTKDDLAIRINARD